jgi:hypothetical protein
VSAEPVLEKMKAKVSIAWFSMRLRWSSDHMRFHLEAAWNMFSWRRVVRGVNDYQTVFNRLVSGLNTSSDWRRSTIKPFGSMKTIPDGSDLI